MVSPDFYPLALGIIAGSLFVIVFLIALIVTMRNRNKNPQIFHTEFVLYHHKVSNNLPKRLYLYNLFRVL